jgi:hypothetical protein
MKVTDIKGWISERRSAPRLRLRLPLIVRWGEGPSVSETFTDSEDLNSRGIYFLLPKDIEVGLVVEIVMVLPTVWVRCQGRIQRTQPQAERQVGVAVAVRRHQFLRDAQNAA